MIDSLFYSGRKISERCENSSDLRNTLRKVCYSLRGNWTTRKLNHPLFRYYHTWHDLIRDNFDTIFFLCRREIYRWAELNLDRYIRIFLVRIRLVSYLPTYKNLDNVVSSHSHHVITLKRYLPWRVSCRMLCYFTFIRSNNSTFDDSLVHARCWLPTFLRSSSGVHIFNIVLCYSRPNISRCRDRKCIASKTLLIVENLFKYDVSSRFSFLLDNS